MSVESRIAGAPLPERLLYCARLLEGLPDNIAVSEHEKLTIYHAKRALKDGQSHGPLYLRGIADGLAPIISSTERSLTQSLDDNFLTDQTTRAGGFAARTGNFIHRYTKAYLKALSTALAGDVGGCAAAFRDALYQWAIYSCDGDPDGAVAMEIESNRKLAEDLIQRAALNLDRPDLARTPTPRGRKCFISYRRADAPYEATFIYDRLSRAFGDDDVFFDVDTIPAGVDFKAHIETYIDRCAVLLAVIGRAWINPAWSTAPAHGLDFVEAELQLAIQLGVPIFPVLVQNTEMPKASVLPKTLASLPERNALTLRSGRDMEADFRKLVGAVETLRSTWTG